MTLRMCLQLFPHLSSEEVLESMFLEIPSKTDFLWLAFLLPQTTPGMDFINVGHHIKINATKYDLFKREWSETIMRFETMSSENEFGTQKIRHSRDLTATFRYLENSGGKSHTHSI